MLADLHLWGRDPAGQWWGLITWGTYGGAAAIHTHCAWLPASTLRQANAEQKVRYGELLRMRLPADRATWPTLLGDPDRSWIHYLAEYPEGGRSILW
jgi:hypothetical protein